MNIEDELPNRQFGNNSLLTEIEPMSEAPDSPANSNFDQKAPASQQSGGSGVWKYLLIGCLGVVLFSVCGCGIGIWYIASNGKMLLFQTLRAPIAQMIEASELTDEDKEIVLQQVDRLGDEWASGRISNEQLGNVMQKLAESPLIPIAMTTALKAKYISKSGLDEAEKAEASKTASRIARGLYEKTIKMEAVQPALAPAMEVGPDGKEKLKDKITDAELREVIESLRVLADDAGVPDENFEIEIGAEFKRVVDEGLAGEEA